MQTKMISLDESIGGGSYEVRIDVPLRVDHMFREKIENFEDAKTLFVKEMVLKPKFTDESLDDTGIDVVDALFLTIVKAAHYQIGELIESFDPDTPKEDYQRIALESQRQRYADLQKKVTVR
jgi:hypothetical protein